MFCPQCGTWNRASSAACDRCGEALPELERGAFERPDDELTRLRRATGNRYRVLRRLGGGGMAEVYIAEQAQLERQVVIKVLHPHLARDAEVAERFRREAEAAAKLVHPHICPILDYGATRRRGVHGHAVPRGRLARRSHSGRTRTSSRRRRRRSPRRSRARSTTRIAAASIHRDVKPDNVLFDEDGNAIITDFGIATARFHGRLTASGRAMGTPHYMSPEQAMGKLVDGRSDIYAVGILLYEALVGLPPFDGADAFSVSYKQVHDTAVPPSTANSARAGGRSPTS